MHVGFDLKSTSLFLDIKILKTNFKQNKTITIENMTNRMMNVKDKKLKTKKLPHKIYACWIRPKIFQPVSRYKDS